MNNRWRTVDILVAAIIAVVFGVIFWAWGLLWFGPFYVAFNFFPPAAALVNGVWFIPAILAPLIIRKPGAGLFAELLAAAISAALGSTWGWAVLWYGLAQGAAGELAFAAYGYRRWTPVQALLGGALAGAAASVLDITTTSIGDYSTGWQLAYAGCQVLSGAIVAGLGSYALTGALARTGALAPFPSGRARELV
jgi:energy-coupling factor transport system substrate-specific component